MLVKTVETVKRRFATYDPYRTIFSLGWIFEPNLSENWPAYLVSGLILVGQATGAWAVSGRTMIDVNSLSSAEDIKGWMTIQQVSTGLDIDLATLYAVMGLSPDIAPETAMKDLEKIVEGFETSLVREQPTWRLAKFLPVRQGQEPSVNPLQKPHLHPLPRQFLHTHRHRQVTAAGKARDQLLCLQAPTWQRLISKAAPP